MLALQKGRFGSAWVKSWATNLREETALSRRERERYVKLQHVVMLAKDVKRNPRLRGELDREQQALNETDDAIDLIWEIEQEVEVDEAFDLALQLAAKVVQEGDDDYMNLLQAVANGALTPEEAVQLV